MINEYGDIKYDMISLSILMVLYVYFGILMDDMVQYPIMVLMVCNAVFSFK